jgi:hypothetical protein
MADSDGGRPRPHPESQPHRGWQIASPLGDRRIGPRPAQHSTAHTAMPRIVVNRCRTPRRARGSLTAVNASSRLSGTTSTLCASVWTWPVRDGMSDDAGSGAAPASMIKVV